MKDKQNEQNGFQWSKFAGLASQWAVALVLLMFLGKYIDSKHFFKTQMPLFIWILPFVFIIISLIDIIKETNYNATQKSKSSNKSSSK